MIRRFLPVLLILAGAAGVTWFFSTLKKTPLRRPPVPSVRMVAAEQVFGDSVSPVITGTGRIVALEQVILVPEVSGTILRRGFSLRKGSAFSKNQVLMKIDDRQSRYALHGTIADLRNALMGLLPEVNVDIPDASARWHTFFSQIHDLHVPLLPPDMTDREKLLATRFQVLKLYYSVLNQKVLLQKHSIRAPFAGNVAQSGVYPSSMARAGTPVATLVRTDSVELEMACTEQDAALLRAGMPAFVTVSGTDDAVEGIIHRIGSFLDENMQTVPVFIRLGNSGTAVLKPGAFGTVSITGTPFPRAFAVSRAAIYGTNQVFIIQNDTLALRKVHPVYVGAETVIFDGGIDDKTLLVTERLPDAVAGMKVKPRKRENDSPRASQNRPMNSSIESSQSYSGGAPQ